MKLFNKNKKGAFGQIAAGMLAFAEFVLVVLMVILMISITRDTSIVTNDANATLAMTYMSEAAILPPQFASLIVIVLIMVGIIGMLGMIGYAAYKKANE